MKLTTELNTLLLLFPIVVVIMDGNDLGGVEDKGGWDDSSKEEVDGWGEEEGVEEEDNGCNGVWMEGRMVSMGVRERRNPNGTAHTKAKKKP